MPMSPEDFRVEYGGEIREALLMIEGDNGGFELMGYGWLAEGGEEGEEFALLRSTGSGRTHLLVRDPETGPGHACRWRAIDRDTFAAFKQQIGRIGGAAPAP